MTVQATRKGPGQSFTLLVPTYNRPRDLARLLRYLARQGADFPILVLDSGDEERRAANSVLAGSLDLDVRVIAYDSAITPFEKFWRGSEEVTTEFCALCADDDLVLVDALPRIVDYMVARPDVSAAHGWYFTFAWNGAVDVTSVVYSGPSIDHGHPLLRLRQLLGRYEAVAYATYRTDVLRGVLREVQVVRSLFARELLAGCLTVVAGKVARLPLFSYGRCLGSSGPHEHWHPMEFLISSPEAMLVEYATARRILAESFRKAGCMDREPADLLRLIDLMHLEYFAQYVTPESLRYAIDTFLLGYDRDQVLRGYWPLATPASSRAWDFVRRNGKLRALRDRLTPGLTLHQVTRLLGVAGEQSIRTTTPGGRERQYRLWREFLQAASQLPSGRVGAVKALIHALDAYE